MDKYNVSAVIKDPKTLGSIGVVLADLKERDVRIKTFIQDCFNDAAAKIRKAAK